MNARALDENPEVQEFVQFYLNNLNQFVQQARYVPLAPEALQETQERFQNRTTGTDPEGSQGEGKGKEEEKAKEIKGKEEKK